VAEVNPFDVVAIPAVRPAAVPVRFVPTPAVGVPRAPLKVTNPPVAFGAFANAVIAPLLAAAHAMVVADEFSITHGAVDPTTVVVPGVIEDALAVNVCQLAAVELVAVKTCPVVGAVAPFTTTVVVAELIPLEIPAVNPEAVPVRFVPTPLVGVPNAPPNVTNPPVALVAFPRAVIALLLAEAQAIVVDVEFSMTHGAVAPIMVVVPGVMEELDPPADHVIGAEPPPPEVKTCPAVPAVIGKLKLNVPAVACGKTVIEPLVVPLSTSPVHAGLNCACAVVAKSSPTRPPRILRIIMTPPAQHPCRIHCH